MDDGMHALLNLGARQFLPMSPCSSPRCHFAEKGSVESILGWNERVEIGKLQGIFDQEYMPDVEVAD